MEEMRKASVICIVYSVENEISIDKVYRFIDLFVSSYFLVLFNQISSYWLPYIHQTLGEDHETPVILGLFSNSIYIYFNIIPFH